jgi:M6 family metalloprotease-like protein
LQIILGIYSVIFAKCIFNRFLRAYRVILRQFLIIWTRSFYRSFSIQNIMEVELDLPKKELFIGSYTKVNVIIDPASGRPIEDLDFILPDGPQAGFVSLSRDGNFNPDKPDVMLCVGFMPGRYILQAWSKQTNSVMAEIEFIITDKWEDDVEGPSQWFSGISELSTMGPTWGGGLPGSPQNINVKPALGTRRIAILLVDTNSQRYTDDAPTLQGIRDQWLNETFRGVNMGGVVRSCDHFYREVSYKKFGVTAEVFGPFHLDGGWDEYFAANRAPKANFFQACVSAGIGRVNYNDFQTILCVSQSVNPTDPTDPETRKYSWPIASTVPNRFITGFDSETFQYLFVDLAVITMPNEWPAIDGRLIHQTLSHELAHNLGLGDLYSPLVKMGAIKFRNPGDWDIMDNESTLPHFSIANRMTLGWIEETLIEPFNFHTGKRVDKPITLYPIEQDKPTPPNDWKAGIEIRIADGKNYYFEYRNGQSVHLGDRNLPNNNRVLGTDVEDPGTAPSERPHILLLRDDEDNDGSVLDIGNDYTESDEGIPFAITVDNIDGNKAELHVQYNAGNIPDPSIRPWPAGPDRQWQSPDIEVRNIRNAFVKDFFNVPWEGNDNWVYAMVKNGGDIDAPKVRVDFFVRTFSFGSFGPRLSLGSDVRDIPAGGTVEFSAPLPPESWKPARQDHYCVEVEIPLYKTPGSLPAYEVNVHNNFSRSNYTYLISRTGSPGSREAVAIEVVNPFSKATRVFIGGGHTNPLYRTFIEHTSLTLEPGERKKIVAMFEFSGDKSVEHVPAWEDYISIPNNVGLTETIEDPRHPQPHTAELLGGVQVKVATGRSTEFIRFDNNQTEFRGLVVTRNDNNPVPGDKVILIISLAAGKREYTTLELSNGEFSAQIRSDWRSVMAYYLPISGYADCYSKRIYNEDIFRLPS